MKLRGPSRTAGYLSCGDDRPLGEVINKLRAASGASCTYVRFFNRNHVYTRYLSYDIIKLIERSRSRRISAGCTPMAITVKTR